MGMIWKGPRTCLNAVGYRHRELKPGPLARVPVTMLSHKKSHYEQKLNKRTKTNSMHPAETPRSQRKQTVICVYSSLTLVLNPRVWSLAVSFIER
jgi:hypothetical protein